MRISLSRQANGFTLLEIVAVLALIGIFAVIAIVQHDASDASLVAQTQVFVSHLRFAQNRSMNSDVTWGIAYHHGASDQDHYYALFRDGNPSETALLPGQSEHRVPLGKMDIAVESAAGANALAAQSFQLTFDSWGTPESLIAGTPSSLSTRLRLNKRGHPAQDVFITQNTGFIQ